MRLAILTSERTGSTTLYNLIKDHLSPSIYICHCEPFHRYFHEKINRPVFSIDFYEDKEDVFIKTFLNKIHRPKELINDDETYWEWFFNFFQKIILLDRKDKNLQSESFTYHSIKGTVSSWHKRQYYDLSGIEPIEFEKMRNSLIDESKTLHLLSEKGYPIFYYEEIYIDRNKKVVEDLFEYIGISLNHELYVKHVFAEKNRIRLKDGESKFIGLI